MDVKRVKTTEGLLKIMDEAEGKGEALSVYVPLHQITWENLHTNWCSQHYFNSIAFDTLDDEMIDILFSSSPFRVVRLYLSYFTKNKNKIIIKVAKDPDDDFNLGFLLFQKFVKHFPGYPKRSLSDRIKSVAEHLGPGLDYNDNVFYFKASSIIVKNYFETKLPPFAMSNLFGSELPVYLSYDQAVKDTLYNSVNLFNNTRKIINTQVKRFLLPTSSKKTTLFNGSISIKDSLDRLIFRKILIGTAKTMDKIFEDFNKKYIERVKSNNFEDFDPENFIDYKEWNKKIIDIRQFSHAVKRKDRLKYFLIKDLHD